MPKQEYYSPFAAAAAAAEKQEAITAIARRKKPAIRRKLLKLAFLVGVGVLNFYSFQEGHWEDLFRAVTTYATKSPDGPSDNDLYEDGCGLLEAKDMSTLQQRQTAVNWAPYNSTSGLVSEEERTYFAKVYECARQFPHSYFETMDTKDFYLTKDKTRMDKLLCNMKITHDRVLDTLQQHRHILFVGDSILRQQYFAFVCMLDPNATQGSFATFYDGTGESANFEYVYNHSSTKTSTGTTDTANATTTLHYAAFGPQYNHRMEHLYETAFPYAVGNYSAADAIVTDASRHFHSGDVHLFHSILKYMQDSATARPASFYYMEPTPEEYPTSNGIYSGPCWENCTCQVHNDLTLKGRATPIDNYRKHGEKLGAPKFEDFIQLYPDQNWTHSFTTDVNDTDMSCLPDCVPADWRVRLVRSKMLGNSSQHMPPTTTFQLVPTFWQLVGRNHHSSASVHQDCTHRSLDAIMMMNEQLVRSMIRRKMTAATTTTS